MMQSVPFLFGQICYYYIFYPVFGNNAGYAQANALQTIFPFQLIGYRQYAVTIAQDGLYDADELSKPSLCVGVKTLLLVSKPSLFVGVNL
jgi:hypothetical protein